MACQPKLTGRANKARLRSPSYGAQPSPAASQRAKVGGKRW
jgi:hypothetical protein